MKSTRIRVTILALMVCIGLSAQIKEAISTFVDDPDLQSAAVGLSIKEVSSGDVIAEYRSKTNMIPASVTKLLTTATALELLTDTFRFVTRIVQEGQLSKDGTLHGNIYVIGGGDPTIESTYADKKRSFFQDCGTAILNSGIKYVDGSIIGDASLYKQQGMTPLWLIEDVGTYYAPTPSSISAFDNIFRIYASIPEGEDKPKLDHTTPHSDLLNIELKYKMSDYKVNSADYSWNLDIEGAFQNGKMSEITTEIPEPALLVADSLRNFLVANGVSVMLPVSTTRNSQFVQSDSCKLLYSYFSDPLSQIIISTNFKSINLFAENIFLYLATTKGKNPASHAASANVVQSYWNGKGVNAKQIYQVDGSGLSMKNSINPDFLVNMLIYMNTKSKYSKSFYKSLPICGVNGTVRSFMSGTPLAGKARFKSGSMERVQNYAGYIEHKGKTYAVSIMVNNYAGSRAELKKKMSKLFNNIFATIE